MNCYLCYEEAGNATRLALGFCQHCGAGICELHLVLVTSRPVSGMGGQAPTSRSFHCTHCQQEIEQAFHPPGRQLRPRQPLLRKTGSWWRRWTGRWSHPLPEPEEAVALVEQFLKQS